MAGLFTAIKLESGVNDINIKWVPKDLKKGMAISLITLVGFILVWVFKRGRRLNIPKWLLWIAGVIFFAVFIGGVLAVLIIPLVFAIPAIVVWKKI